MGKNLGLLSVKYIKNQASENKTKQKPSHLFPLSGKSFAQERKSTLCLPHDFAVYDIYSHGDVHVEYHPNGITTPLHWVDATLEVCVCVSGGVYLQRAESPSSMLQKPIDNICN